MSTSHSPSPSASPSGLPPSPAGPILITPDTDLTALAGVQVQVQRTVGGVRWTYTGVLTGLRHSPKLNGATATFDTRSPHVGRTAFHLGYGDATVEVIGEADHDR